MKIHTYGAILFAGALLISPLGGYVAHAQNAQVVNGEDLGLVLANWGPCPQPTVSSTANSLGCESDLNNDGEVNQVDVDMVLQKWTNKPQRAANKNPDINTDGKVDGADLGMVLTASGRCLSVCDEDLNSDGIVGKADRHIVLATWTSTEKPNLSAEQKTRIRAGANVRVNSTANTARPNITNAERQAETRERLLRRDSLTQYLTTITNRLMSGVVRAESLHDRIESRIEKLRALGGNITVSAQFLAEAEAEISRARTSLASLPKSFSETTTSRASSNIAIMTTESLIKVRSTIAEVKMNLQSAHKNLVGAISNLKSLNANIGTETSVEIN